MSIAYKHDIQFPEFSGVRCLMMPYTQGDPSSVPIEYSSYAGIIESTFVQKGDVGFLTIDESYATKGRPHRGARARTSRALHTEAGYNPDHKYQWGRNNWGDNPEVEIEESVRVLLANNISGTCALWNATQKDTSLDGDIGHLAHIYPYEDAVMMNAGQVWEIGVLTPHESLPVREDSQRQFLRIVSAGVHGREPYFTKNPIMGDYNGTN